MMWEDQGVIVVCSINVIASIVLLLLLRWIHRRYKYVYHSRHTTDDENVSFVTWRLIPLNTTLNRSGGSAAVYLATLRAMLYVILTGAPVAIVSVIINATDNYNEVFLKDKYTPGIRDWTLSNVHPESWRLWLHMFASFALCGALYVGVWRLFRFYEKIKLSASESTAARHTALVYGVPATTPEDVRETTGDEKGNVVAVHIPRVDDGAFKALVERRQAQVPLLRHARLHNALHPMSERLLARPSWYRGKEDAVSLYTRTIKELDESVVSWLIRYNTRGSCGPLFITFATTTSQFAYRERVNRWDVAGWSVVPPKPSDVLWDRLHISPYQQVVRSIIVVALMAVLTLFWSVPVAFLSSLKNLAGVDVIGEPFKFMLRVAPTVAGFIDAYLPVIVLAVFNIVLPLLCRVLTHFEGPHTMGALNAGAMRKYITFLFCTVILWQAVFQGGIAGIQSIVEDATLQSILALFVAIVSPQGGFFMAKVVQAGMLSMWVGLLRIGPLLVGHLKARQALDGCEQRVAFQVPHFEYWREYPEPMLIFCICFVFAVTMPVIVPLGVIYFASKVLRDQFMLNEIYPAEPTGELRLTYSVMQFLLVAGGVHQFGMLGLLVAKEAVPCAIVYLIAPMVGVYIHIRLWREERILHNLSRMEYLNVQEVDDPDVRIVSTAYTHPAVRYDPVSLESLLDRDPQDDTNMNDVYLQ